jgi:hypothetical protein
MSAFQHHPEHIAAIVGSAMALTPLTIEQAIGCARALAAENAASVDARYSHHEPTVPHPPTAQQIRAWEAAPLSAAGLDKAMRSMAYQSCEHEGWASSIAGAWLSMLDAALPHRRRHSVDDGCWSITAPPATR